VAVSLVAARMGSKVAASSVTLLRSTSAGSDPTTTTVMSGSDDVVIEALCATALLQIVDRASETARVTGFLVSSMITIGVVKIFRSLGKSFMHENAADCRKWRIAWLEVASPGEI